MQSTPLARVGALITRPLVAAMQSFRRSQGSQPTEFEFTPLSEMDSTGFPGPSGATLEFDVEMDEVMSAQSPQPLTSRRRLRDAHADADARFSPLARATERPPSVLQRVARALGIPRAIRACGEAHARTQVFLARRLCMRVMRLLWIGWLTMVWGMFMTGLSSGGMVLAFTGDLEMLLENIVDKWYARFGVYVMPCLVVLNVSQMAAGLLLLFGVKSWQFDEVAQQQTQPLRVNSPLQPEPSTSSEDPSTLPVFTLEPSTSSEHRSETGSTSSDTTSRRRPTRGPARVTSSDTLSREEAERYLQSLDEIQVLPEEPEEPVRQRVMHVVTFLKPKLLIPWLCVTGITIPMHIAASVVFAVHGHIATEITVDIFSLLSIPCISDVVAELLRVSEESSDGIWRVMQAQQNIPAEGPTQSQTQTRTPGRSRNTELNEKSSLLQRV